MPTVTTSTALRNAIQAASVTDGTGDITLAGISNFSVVTLAKIGSYNPAPYPESGYTIQGNGQTISNTRIYEDNIDSYSPWNIIGNIDLVNPLALTFSYTSNGAADGTALLRSTSGSYYLDGLLFTGTHRGWDGNSNLYMSLTGFDPANPITADLLFANSTIEIKGQGNFNPATPNIGGSAFLHSWNNDGNIFLDNNTFDEAGYLSSFNFFNQSTHWGSYTVRNSTFTRSSNANVRRRGNRLTNVNIELTDNIFEKGAFLDVFGDLDGISFTSDPVFGPGFASFNTITNGYGIRANYDSSLGYVTGSIAVLGELRFSGGGLPLKYEQYSAPTPAVFTLDAGLNGGKILISNSLITDHQVTQASAGGQASDLIDPYVTTTHIWAYGDLGNDTINGAAEEDYLDGGSGNDSINGLNGFDTILGGAGLDTLSGGGGDDRIFGEADNDVINGNDGADSIDAGSGNDLVFGSTNNDTILGGLGNDTLLGEDNTDILTGNDGNDTLNGGTANDTLTGGNGNDLFVWKFRTSPVFAADGTDTITDFTSTSPAANVDKMGLTDVFNNTSPNNTLNALDFATAASMVAMSLTDDNKVIRITAGQTNTQITGTLRAGLLNAYVLVFNSSAAIGTLVFDDNWGNTANRTTVARYTNLTTLASVSSFTNNNFFAV